MYLIVRRKDAEAAKERFKTGQGRTLSKMFLSQPPPRGMEAEVWERERLSVQGTDSPMKTTELSRPRFKCDQGVSLGFMHRKVCEMFDEHQDVVAIKLTSV